MYTDLFNHRARSNGHVIGGIYYFLQSFEQIIGNVSKKKNILSV